MPKGHDHQAPLPANIMRRANKQGKVEIYDKHAKAWVWKYPADAKEMLANKSGTFNPPNKKDQRTRVTREMRDGARAAEEAEKEAAKEAEEQAAQEAADAAAQEAAEQEANEQQARVIKKIEAANRDELANFCRTNDLDVNLDDFEKLGEKREAVKNAFLNSIDAEGND